VSDAGSHDDLPVRRGLLIPGSELREQASRAGGPGGQHVNKANTRVTLRWSFANSGALSEAQRARIARRLATRVTRQGELVVHAADERSRARNRALARERLAALVRGALALRRPRRPTRPTAGGRERRLGAKQRRSELKRARRPRPSDED
jgi:ribosome-associated protein